MDPFVSEPLKPVKGTFDPSAMSRGEAGLPQRFDWRGKPHAVVRTLRAWKSSAREGGVGELYLRRHWYEVQTNTGWRLTIYCERQARSAATAKQRWFVYTAAKIGQTA